MSIRWRRDGRHIRHGSQPERWRIASKQMTAAAMAALRLSARPAWGMLIHSSTGVSSGRPWASLPTTTATRPVRSTLCRAYAARRGAEQAQPQRAHLPQLDLVDDGHEEQRARSGPHHLGVGHVDRVRCQRHGVGARGLGCAEDGAEIAGVGQAGRHDHEVRGTQDAESGRPVAHHCQQGSGRLRGRHPLEHAGSEDMTGRAASALLGGTAPAATNTASTSWPASAARSAMAWPTTNAPPPRALRRPRRRRSRWTLRW